MFSLFEFAVGVRLLMFVVFVACVYGGNALFVHLEHRKTKFLWKLAFVTLYSIFLLLVTYVVWLVFLLWFKCLKSIIHLDIQKIHLVFRWDGFFYF